MPHTHHPTLTRSAPAQRPLASRVMLVALPVLILVAGSTPAAGGTQATIRVSARVINITGGQSAQQASAALLEELDAATSGAADVGTAASPRERYVEDGLIRVSLLAQGTEVGTGIASPEPAATTAAQQVLIEYVAN